MRVATRSRQRFVEQARCALPLVAANVHFAEQDHCELPLFAVDVNFAEQARCELPLASAGVSVHSAGAEIMNKLTVPTPVLAASPAPLSSPTERNVTACLTIPVITISSLLPWAAQSAWIPERLHEEALQARVEIEHHKLA